MALSWMGSEGIAVDVAGAVHDLTIRSFGVLRAVDTPPIEVVVEPDDGPPARGSDAVFAAVAAAAWFHAGTPSAWPTGTRWRSRSGADSGPRDGVPVGARWAPQAPRHRRTMPCLRRPGGTTQQQRAGRRGLQEAR